MKIRDKINKEIKKMSLDEISILYEQIKLIKKIKIKPKIEDSLKPFVKEQIKKEIVYV